MNARADKLEAQQKASKRETAREKARRRWKGAGGIAVVITATGTIRKVARQNTGATLTAAGAAALGAVTALAIGIGGDDQQPPIAGPRPAITITTTPPAIPPPSASPDDRHEPGRPRPQQPPHVVALPVPDAPTAKRVVNVGGPPKAPQPSPEQPTPPLEEQPPLDTVENSLTCVADIQLTGLRVALLCPSYSSPITRS